MIWLICILGLPLLVLCWLLFSAILIELDSRIPEAGIQWGSIGKARIWYDSDWRLCIRVFFYTKTFRVGDIRSGKAKRKKIPGNLKTAKKAPVGRIVRRAVRVINTFHVQEWRLAVDTGDFTQNARLFPLNYLPGLVKHLFINFNGENYLAVKIRNHPWKILYAFLR